MEDRKAETRTMLPQTRKAQDRICSWRRRRRTYSRRFWEHPGPVNALTSNSQPQELRISFSSFQPQLKGTGPARSIRAKHPSQPQPQAESWLREADKPRGYSAGSHLLMTWQGLTQNNFLREPEEIFPMRQCASLMT